MDERWAKAIGIGGLIALGGAAVWQSLSPDTKGRIDGWLGDFLAVVKTQRLEEEERRRLALQQPVQPVQSPNWLNEILRDWPPQVQTFPQLALSLPVAESSDRTTPACLRTTGGTKLSHTRRLS